MNVARVGVGIAGVLAALAVACGGTIASDDDGGVGGFVTQLNPESLDKIDILFAIDNSASMADKQDLLADAIPTLFNRLLNPDCVDQTSGAHVPGDNGGGNNPCKSIPNTKPEFSPIHDLHVAVVSSSLGGGGSPDVCLVSNPEDPSHQDDEGHLLNRTSNGGAQGSVSNAKPVDGNGGNFLAWLPTSNPKNAGKPQPNVTAYSDGQASTLTSDFQSLVTGAGETGCGLEAQLESWYRFLIQPDPYDHIALTSDSPPRASLEGVDVTLLKMRHDFLRPDSLVAILQVTDEDDSWSDPLWLGGFGWTVRTQTFPGGPGKGVGPRGTSECDQPIDVNNPTTTGPNNPDCTSCAFPGSSKPVSGQPIGSDPNCQSCAPGATACVQKGWYSPPAIGKPVGAADGLNVRYGDQTMQQRYGLDPQFAIQRYVDGLTQSQVPDRDNESHDDRNYAPTPNCTNPLFAASLPDGSDTSPGALCNLKLGSRTPDLVFYALLGGVPNSLVDTPNGDPKVDLTAGDWQKIVGKDPAHFDLTGIDPHMIESTAPRPGLPSAGSSYALGSDPESGREWNTLTSGAGIDQQFACVFDLPTPRDCAGAPASCDCSGANGATTSPDGPPLCDPQMRTTQIKAKAYPTIRELRVAQGLGSQSFVASLCAKDTSGADAAQPSYGYRPAMNAFVDRLASALSGQCLPKQLVRGSDGTVSCDIYVVYPNQTAQASGCTDPGMAQPTPSEITRFDAQYASSLGASGPSPVVCIYTQLGPGDFNGASCQGAPAAGWCYVEGQGNTGGCAQAIQTGASGPPAGTELFLECLQ